MKVYITPNESGRALERVTQALARYKPKRVEIVSDKAEAGLIVLHVIGRRDAVRREVEQIKRDGKKCAVIQYAFKSTMTPEVNDWWYVWAQSEVVWSYYDLEQERKSAGFGSNANFYHSPLGVDSTIFKPEKVYSRERDVITTVGRGWLTESVRECALAARRVGRIMTHVGDDLGDRGPGLTSATNISDKLLAQIYTNSDFVSGLRRVEGFELPAAEGLLCGARPILFDQPHYKHWYGSWAEYIPEAPREQVVDSLEALFKEGVRPVSAKERTAAKKRFDWTTIVGGFWSKI